MPNNYITISDELLLPAEAAQFGGTIEEQTLEAGPDVYTFDGPLSWSASVQNTGDALLVMGEVSGKAHTSCARCLDDFSLDVHGDIEGYFLIDGEASAPEDMDDDEFDVLPESHQIDIATLAIAGILVELPLVPLCKEDCLGLCAQCGANLNDGPCECQKADSTEQDLPRMSDGRVSPFAVLKDFNFGDSAQ